MDCPVLVSILLLRQRMVLCGSVLNEGLTDTTDNWFLITHWLQKCRIVMPVAEISN